MCMIKVKSVCYEFRVAVVVAAVVVEAAGVVEVVVSTIF